MQRPPHPRADPGTLRRLAVLLLLLCAPPLLLSACAAARGIEALAVLSDIGAGQDARDGDMMGVARIELRGPGLSRADLYVPARGDTGAPLPAAAALLLVPGLAETGKDDPRIVALAASLARARIAVMVPDLVSLRELRAGPENVAEIAAALDELAGPGRGLWAMPEGAAAEAGMPRPVGVAAVSYAVGPALLATLTPALAGKVDFLVGVGGYYDMTAALTFATTGWHRDMGGAWRRGAANDYGKWVFVQANAARVVDPADRTTLAAMARRRLGDPAAPIDDLAATLGPEGRAVHAFIVNGDRERVPGLIAALPAPIRADLMALDVSRHDLAAAPPHVLLLHGRDDAILPAGESAALAAALGPARARLVLLDSLAHADLGLDGLADLYRMWRAVYWLLAVRDGAVSGL